MIISFADDTAVNGIWDSIQLKVNDNFILIYKWLALNKLSLSLYVNKTGLMTFGSFSNCVNVNFKIQINAKQAKRVEKCMYFG